MNATQKELIEKINDINKWRWQMMGAAAVIAALISMISEIMPALS